MHTRELDLKCQICSKCNTPNEHVIDIAGVKRKVAMMCKCQKENYEKRIEEEANKEHIRRLEKLRRYSLMDEKFKASTFESWEQDSDNKLLFKICKNYCENWKEMKRENVGMLLYGKPGTGKSYMSFCIANELLSKGVPVIATSSINLINKIYESYRNYGDEGEVETINQLKNASLLVLDDLGAEHDGRTGKEKQIIYSVIDSRIRANKPTIITTNLTPKQLESKLTGTDGVTRTYDRIIEACPPIEVTGKSRRIEKAYHKMDLIKKLAM